LIHTLPYGFDDAAEYFNFVAALIREHFEQLPDTIAFVTALYDTRGDQEWLSQRGSRNESRIRLGVQRQFLLTQFKYSILSLD